MSRTVKLVVEAKVDGLVAGLKTAKKASHDFAREAKKTLQENRADWQTLGDASAKAGAAAALGLGLVAKAAMGWQSAWTGVLKTVDGSPRQLGEVEDGLRGLARVLPSSHTEIAAVAEAAGQLGVATGDVVGFTKVMIDLGQSTNLSAEDAATSLARFSNIMGTSNQEVGRLGATLVGLGNNYATTESEIMDMSMRLAGAGRQIGLSEGQTMGLAAAMSSVGIEAEAGGTAMSLTMKRIGKAVDNGGGSLETFAGTAGMTADQFAKKWKGDAAGGLEAFVLGLQRAGEQGQSVNGILTELGITGIRESDALLRLSSAGELMGEAMKQGAMEYQAGTALLEEATKRYETAESKVSIAWNNIKDAAIDAGAVMLPVISQLSEGVAGLAQWFTSLPQPVKTLVVALGGLVATGGLSAFAITKVARVAEDMISAFGKVAPAGGKMRSVLGDVGKAAGLAAIAVTALAVAAEMITQKHTTRASDYADAVIKIAKAGEQAKSSDFDSVFSSWDQMAGDTSDNIGGLSEAITRLANPEFGDGLNQFMDEAFAWTPLAKSDVTQIRERLGDLGDELGNIASGGNAEQAADAFRVLAAEFQNNGMSAQDALDTMPAYSEALKKIASDAGESVEPNELLQWALTGIAPAAVAAAQGLEEAGGVVAYVGNAAGETIPVTEEMAKALEEIGVSAEGSIVGLSAFVDYLFASGLAVMSSRDAAFQWNDTLRDMGDEIGKVLEKQAELGPALDKTGKEFNKNSDTGKAANKMFTDTLREGLEVAKTYAGDVSKSQEDVQKQLESTYKAGLKTAEGYGIGKEAAIALTRETMAIPEGVSIESWFSTEAQRAAESLTGAVREVPDSKSVEFETNAKDVSGQILDLHDKIQATPDKSITIDDNSPAVKAALESLGYIVTNLPDGKIQVSETGTDATGQKIDNVAGKKRIATIDAAAATDAAEAALNYLARQRNATIQVNVNRSDSLPSGALSTPGGGKKGFATGGPIFGPGTGTSDSIPALLSNGEHVWTAEEVRRAGGHTGIERLRGLAKAGLLPAFAKGGRVGWSKRDEAAKKREYEALKAAKADDKKVRRAQDEWRAAKERTARLSAEEFDLRRDVKRGSIRDSFTSGSGMSVVDRLFDESRNKDLSKSQRGRLRSLGYSTEKQLLKLEKQSESLAKKLDAAREKRDELLAVQQGVASGLRGEFSLTGLISDQNRDTFNPFTSKTGLAGAKAHLSKLKAFAGKLNALQKKGFSGDVVQEIASMGIIDGTVAADALLQSTAAEVKEWNSTYAGLNSWSNKAGEYVTNAMHKGGINAAQGLVDGLEGQQKAVESAFYKLGKAAEKAFKKALGIKSPSTVMADRADDTVDGLVNQLGRRAPDVGKAMSMLAQPPQVYGGWSIVASAPYQRASGPAPVDQSVHVTVEAKEGIAYEYAHKVGQAAAVRVKDTMTAYQLN